MNVIPPIPNSLEQHWMPFTSNRHFKANPRILTGALYARVDDDGDVRLGASTGIGQTLLSLEMSRSGPSASLQLPVMQWLGLSRWVPLGAQLEIGLDGIAAVPRVLR